MPSAMKWMALGLMCGLARGTDYKSTGAAFEEPPSISSSNGRLDTHLDFDYFTYEGPTATVKTRAINGSMPGPTIRFSPGDTVRVLMNNKMNGDPNPSNGHNRYTLPETTNLHTHGLHIGSLDPEDNVAIAIAPGASHQYEYAILATHCPGTHWYHPHHHGSTALQVMGGAAGALIIDDPPGSLPDTYLSMTEKLLVYTHMNMQELTEIAEESGDTYFSITGTPRNNILLNGMTTPVLSLQPGEWQRWRMVFAGVDEGLSLQLSGCELQLMAKDGVYLQTLPRLVTTIQLAPGARADVAVRCASAGTYSLVSTGMGRTFFTGTIATVSVSGELKPTSDLPSYSYTFPSYLKDLTAATVGGTFSARFAGGGGCAINGNAYVAYNNYLTCMDIETVQEWTLNGVDAHPFHLHINPYQIQSASGASSYYQAGDWHDVLLSDGDGAAVVRFKTADYYGPAVLHCHILAHEDQGCMGVVYIKKDANDTCAVEAVSGAARPVVQTWTCWLVAAVLLAVVGQQAH